MRSTKRILFSLTLLATSGILCLLAGEMFLRLFHPAPYYGYQHIPPQQQFFQHDSLLGWRGTPHASGFFAGKDFHASVTHDGNGYRNATFPYIEERENILILGDSFGWGWGVDDNQVFSSYITNENEDINVYNLSAPGHGTDQEYLVLKQFLDAQGRAGYRGVILLFYFNDFQDVAATTRYTYPKPRFVLRGDSLVLENVPVPEPDKAGKKTKARRQKISLLRKFHVYNLVRQKAPDFLTRLGNKIAGRTATPPRRNRDLATVTEDARRLALRLLQEIKSLCDSNYIFFHVVLLRTAGTDEKRRQELETFSTMLSEENIACSYFDRRTFPSTDLWLDSHLSAYGHKLLASHIVEILRRQSKTEGGTN